MQNQFIEVFYLFFQGILVFQIITFGFIYVMTKRRDTLFYALFLFFAAVYFFVNAPYTFFGISEDVVWNSAWYDFINTPLVILENLCYILFLKSFYQDISADQSSCFTGFLGYPRNSQKQQSVFGFNIKRFDMYHRRHLYHRLNDRAS